MSDEPIIGNAPNPPPPGIEQAEPATGVRIARVPVTLDEGQTTFQVELREPAIVRAAAFWLHTPRVLASAMRPSIQKQPMPMLFVECDAGGEMTRRTFAFIPTDATLGVKEGYTASYRATAIMQTQNGLLTAHLFEIVQVPS